MGILKGPQSIVPPCANGVRDHQWMAALFRVSCFWRAHAFHSRFPTRHAPMQTRTGSDAAGAWTCIHLHCAHGVCFLQLAGVMQSLISPVTKAILVALFIFAILLILYVILWYICRDVDCDHGIWLTLLDASLRHAPGVPALALINNGAKGDSGKCPVTNLINSWNEN